MKHPAWGFFFALGFSLIVWWAAIVVLTSCASPTWADEQSIQEAVDKARTAESVLRRNVVSALAARLAVDVEPVVEVIEPPTDCQWVHRWHREGHAVYVNPHRTIRAGKQFQAVFARHFVTAPREQPSWLLVSFAPPGDPIPLAGAGWTGCHLLVNPDPRFLMAITPAAGSFLRPEHGRLVLDWTPDEGMVGWELWMQQVWLQQGANAAGALLGPMLHLRVGSR